MGIHLTERRKAMRSVWDKKSAINGQSAERFLERNKFLQNEETIYINTVDGRVANVESKRILAKVYGIDPTLPDDEFIAEYERILAMPPEEIPEEEEPDTTTYAELAQVYAEGVNSIE
jgi:hypothetical protein